MFMESSQYSGLLRGQEAIVVATWVIFVSIIIIRLAMGYFPSRTKWFGLFGLLGLLRLWLKHQD